MLKLARNQRLSYLLPCAFAALCGFMMSGNAWAFGAGLHVTAAGLIQSMVWALAALSVVQLTKLGWRKAVKATFGKIPS